MSRHFHILLSAFALSPVLALAQPATSADITSVTKEVHGVHNDIVYGDGQLGLKLDTLELCRNLGDGVIRRRSVLAR